MIVVALVRILYLRPLTNSISSGGPMLAANTLIRPSQVFLVTLLWELIAPVKLQRGKRSERAY